MGNFNFNKVGHSPSVPASPAANANIFNTLLLAQNPNNPPQTEQLRSQPNKRSITLEQLLDPNNTDLSNTIFPKIPSGTKIDLSGRNLTGSDLSGVNLQDAILNYANLRNANLRGANLSNAILDAPQLNRANLSGANLQNAAVNFADMTEADLRGADLQHAQLGAVNWTKTKLAKADLRYAQLSDDQWNTLSKAIDLKQADLRSTIFYDDVNLRAEDLSGANLQGTVFKKPTKPKKQHETEPTEYYQKCIGFPGQPASRLRCL